jgi:RNA polymerase-binding transcription factor DksA
VVKEETMTPASKGTPAKRPTRSRPAAAKTGNKSSPQSVAAQERTAQKKAASVKKTVSVKKATATTKKSASPAKKAPVGAASSRKAPAPAANRAAAPAKKAAAPAKKAATSGKKAATNATAAKKAASTKGAAGAPAAKKATGPATKKATETPAKSAFAPKPKPAPVRPKTGPYAKDAKFLDEVKELLLAERAIYQEQATSLRAEADSLALEREPGDVQFDEESGEGGTVTVDRERNLALSGQATLAVEEIDDALARIDDKTYGYCERCFQPIPKPRLRALPYARLCVACKSGGLSRR